MKVLSTRSASFQLSTDIQVSDKIKQPPVRSFKGKKVLSKSVLLALALAASALATSTAIPSASIPSDNSEKWALEFSLVSTAEAQAAKTPEEARAQAQGLSLAFEDTAKNITPSVVNISAIKKAKVRRSPGKMQPNDPFFDQFKQYFGDDFMDRFQGGGGEGGGSDDGGSSDGQQGLGTGVIVSTDGYILTNNHVVAEADELKVRVDGGQSYKAELIGTDPRSDLAVIKIKAKNLVAAKLGSSTELKIGEWVVAAGNPFGLDNSITAGIISAKGRSLMGGGQYEDFIQTDAAINPGNSGGPLVNLYGEVIGINTAIFSRSGGYMGIGFAIPIDMAKNVMDSLIKNGKVVRGWLGVGIQNLTEDLAGSFSAGSTSGALVGHVEEGGPAEKAGLRQGDIITEFDGVTIKDVNMLRNMVANVTPDKNIKIKVIRDGKERSFDVKVGELPTTAKGQPVQVAPKVDLGLSLEDLNPETAKKLGTKLIKGVLVKGISAGSLGALAGISPRDIIVRVGSEKVETVAQFYDLIEKADLKKGVRLVVVSDGMERFVFLRNSPDDADEAQ